MMKLYSNTKKKKNQNHVGVQNKWVLTETACCVFEQWGMEDEIYRNEEAIITEPFLMLWCTT